MNKPKTQNFPFQLAPVPTKLKYEDVILSFQHLGHNSHGTHFFNTSLTCVKYFVINDVILLISRALTTRVWPLWAPYY